MANHKSALKRARQSRTRQKRNTHIKSTMRTHVKRFRAAVEGDPELFQDRARWLARSQVGQQHLTQVPPEPVLLDAGGHPSDLLVLLGAWSDG